ncbi:MAG: DNA cytosine methyltransferase [Campylobacter sp.]|uniref:DNA cytosine methyltransferase n=1 Tax=Campylobacter sp. TaxID=205 RepID=UPI001B025E60|nr:DNA cytosine methyltransferase [Campylobacter sp.]MBO5062892.1 DNA cytosine methyltransferase [Campylobacter sp.]MBO5062921.1 DNA cytosine methyltransferase [Campylobacter sp.]
MRVLSLFDGISCGMVALERAGIDVERYVAYEIEENAIKVSKSNYPQIEQKGDVFKAEYTEGEFDLLIGGSPCTHWSIARGGQNRETTASGIGFDLFMQYVRALEEVKPKYFLYENNKSMSEDIKNEITKRLGVEPIMIDSADFSAQSRQRYYWTNIPVLLDWEKSKLVFKDIEYVHDYTTGDFSKYIDTMKVSRDGSSVRWDTSGKGYYSQHSRARVKDAKMTTLCCSATSNKIYLGDCKYRGLHPIEAERLQTLPDNYTSCISAKGKRIGLCGNGWTVDIITHILKGIKEG